MKLLSSSECQLQLLPVSIFRRRRPAAEAPVTPIPRAGAHSPQRRRSRVHQTWGHASEGREHWVGDPWAWHSSRAHHAHGRHEGVDEAWES